MKKLIYILLFLIPSVLSAQIITEKDVKISESGTKKLKNAPKKIYFKEFSIGYQSIIEASTVGIDRKASTKISMTAGLDSELTEADVQKITDDAYAKVVRRLTDAGFSIISSAEAKKIDEYQKKVNTTVGGKIDYVNGYIYTQPTGTEYYKVTSGVNEAVQGAKKALSKQSKLLGSLPALSLLDKGSLSDNTGKIAEQLGNVLVADFGMNINFAKITEDRKGGGSSELKGEFGLGAHPYISKIVWKGNGKFGNFESAIMMGTKNYKPFEIEGVIKKEKIKKVAKGDFRTDWGSGIIYAQRKDIKVTNPVKADRAIYIAKVTQAIDEYLEIFISRLTDAVK